MVVNDFWTVDFVVSTFVSFSAYTIMSICHQFINCSFFCNVCWPLKYVLALSLAMTSFKCMTSFKGNKPKTTVEKKRDWRCFPSWCSSTVYLRFRNRQRVNEKCHCLLNCWYVFWIYIYLWSGAEHHCILRLVTRSSCNKPILCTHDLSLFIDLWWKLTTSSGYGALRGLIGQGHYWTI